MNIKGLGLVHHKNYETDEIIGTRVKRNTNTDLGKQLLLLKLNPESNGTFDNPLPAAVSVGNTADRYRVLLFGAGSGAPGATVSANTSLNKLVPLKLTTDSSADTNVYFKPTLADKELIADTNYSTHASATKDDFYWKKIDSFSREGTNSIKYKLEIRNDDIVSQDTSVQKIVVDELGLYAVATTTTAGGAVEIDESLPKILFARLAETYDKSSAMGIVIEWIVAVL